MNEEILSIIEAAEKRGLSHFGIRQHHAIVSVGDDLGVSYNTLDDQAPEELGGICCMTISYDGFDVENFAADLAELKAGNYQAGSIVLVGGATSEYGNDQNEIIIGRAEVLAVIE
jgi:hypothetical protein